jgi:methyl-accepting chemotaxis protein
MEIKMQGGNRSMDKNLAKLSRMSLGFQWWINLKIGIKLTLGFIVVAMIAGAIGLVGTLNIFRISRAGQTVYQENITVLGPLHRISTQLLKVRSNTVYHVLETNDKFRYEFQIKTARTNINNELAGLKNSNVTVTEQLDNLKKAFATYWKEETAVLKLSNQSNTAEATSRMNQTLNSLSSLIESIIDGLFASSNTEVKTKTEDNYTTANRTILFMLAMAAIGLLAALALGIVISRSISKPIKSLTGAAQQLATGDLNVAVTPVNAKDETAILTNAFVKMADSLRGLVTGINEDSNTLNMASQELKNASNDTGKSAHEVAKTMEELARAASEQATQTNEAVESINVVAELVRHVSNEVGNISVESKKVAQSAQLGQKSTNDVAQEMMKIYDMTKEVTRVIEELDKSSVEISSITALIQNIAEQTTLLALNAAIEAARAGEHGIGFGVVATETGKLADQSKQAAQLIESLIYKMSKRSRQVVQTMSNEIRVVESGKNLAANATTTFGNIFDQLNHILQQIDRVAVSAQKMANRNEGMIGIVTNIAALSQESTASTEEVSAAMEEQSASVEQVNNLANNLATISDKLQQSIAQFHFVSTLPSDSYPGNGQSKNTSGAEKSAYMANKMTDFATHP